MMDNSVLFVRTQFCILTHATATSGYNALIVYIKISSLSFIFLQFSWLFFTPEIVFEV